MNPTLSEREMETMKEMSPAEALPPHHQTQREEVLKNEGNFTNPICLESTNWRFSPSEPQLYQVRQPHQKIQSQH